MTGAAMTLLAGAGMLAGFGFGRLYFAAIRRTAQLLASGAWRAPLLLTIGRLATALAVFGLAARLGAACLLGVLLGLLVARSTALRQARRAE